jgi:hypothetical protein
MSHGEDCELGLGFNSNAVAQVFGLDQCLCQLLALVVVFLVTVVLVIVDSL